MEGGIAEEEFTSRFRARHVPVPPPEKDITNSQTVAAWICTRWCRLYPFISYGPLFHAGLVDQEMIPTLTTNILPYSPTSTIVPQTVVVVAQRRHPRSMVRPDRRTNHIAPRRATPLHNISPRTSKSFDRFIKHPITRVFFIASPPSPLSTGLQNAGLATSMRHSNSTPTFLSAIHFATRSQECIMCLHICFNALQSRRGNPACTPRCMHYWL